MNKLSTIEELADALSALFSNGKMMAEYSRSGRGEIFILKHLYEKNAPVLPTELSEAMQSSTARISAVLGSLEKKGQIHREIDTLNRRYILVTITDAGRDRVRHLTEQMRNHLIHVLARMGEQDAAEFVRLSQCFFEIARQSLPESGFMECECNPPDA